MDESEIVTPQMAAARAAAQEFLLRLSELEAAKRGKKGLWGCSFPRESGAVRRQSMELTRALASLRKTGGMLHG